MADFNAITVENRSSGPIEVMITKYSYTRGSDAWYTLQPGKKDSWARSYWEAVIFRQPRVDATRVGVYVANGDAVVFNSLSDIQTPRASASTTLSTSFDASSGSKIVVENKTTKPIVVLVSSSSNAKGSEGWFAINPGSKDTWNRSSWELVAIRDFSNGENRTGTYVQAGSHVVFNGFDSSWQEPPSAGDPKNITVENRFSEAIEVFVSKYSNDNGSAAWFTVQPGKKDTWARSSWEVVAFRQPGIQTTQAGTYVSNGDIVIFNNFSDIKTSSIPGNIVSSFYNSNNLSSIVVENKAAVPVDVFVSKWSNSNGSVAWFTLQPNTSDSWSRSFWEVISFKDSTDSSKRTGVYVPNGSHTVFNGFGGGSSVSPPASNNITVENQSSGPIEVLVSKYSNAYGSEAWYTVQPGKKDTWARSYWEVAIFRQPGDDTTRAGAYVTNSDTVFFKSFSDIQTSRAPASKFLSTSHDGSSAAGTQIVVENKSAKPVSVFVSTLSNTRGSDSWYILQPGKQDTWGSRTGYELVSLRDPSNGNNRTGAYVQNGSRVTFNGFA